MNTVGIGLVERLALATLRVACALLELAETVHYARVELHHQVRRWSR